jgi:hypothetical protein
MNESRSNTRAALLKLRVGRVEIRSIKLNKPAAPKEDPIQAARMGNRVNGRKLSGTGNMALANEANNRLAIVDPAPARRAASINGPTCKGVYPFIDLRPFSIDIFLNY